MGTIRDTGMLERESFGGRTHENRRIASLDMPAGGKIKCNPRSVIPNFLDLQKTPLSGLGTKFPL